MTCACGRPCAALTALTDRVRQLERQHHRGRLDPAADQRLLSAIAASVGAAVFSAADLVRHARHDHELRRAINGASPRQIGKVLRRLYAHPSGAYRAERIGRDGNGSLWLVRASGD